MELTVLINAFALAGPLHARHAIVPIECKGGPLSRLPLVDSVLAMSWAPVSQIHPRCPQVCLHTQVNTRRGATTQEPAVTGCCPLLTPPRPSSGAPRANRQYFFFYLLTCGMLTVVGGPAVHISESWCNFCFFLINYINDQYTQTFDKFCHVLVKRTLPYYCYRHERWLPSHHV